MAGESDPSATVGIDQIHLVARTELPPGRHRIQVALRHKKKQILKKLALETINESVSLS